jgi:CSLREA domain-containing protein
MRLGFLSCTLSAFLAVLAFASPAHAANYSVGSSGDEPDANFGDGICQTAVATCTLRAAIQSANVAAGPDVIVFSVATPATINLTGILPDIAAGGLTIQGPGPGPGAVTVRRDTGGDYRIFRVLSGSQLDLSGLTITNGRAAAGSGKTGGGITNEGTLHLDGVTVTGNTVIDHDGSDFAYGGGVYNGGQMSIVRSTITDNTASVSTDSSRSPFAAGGGVADDGSSEISDSTISGNHATAIDGSARGGGVYASRATKLTNVTVTGNTTTASGSGAETMGGGAYADSVGAPGPALTITSSTIASNSAASGANLATSGVVSMSVRNTIVSDPLAGANCYNEGGGSITSAGFNLASGTSCAFASGGDQQGVDPLLAALGDNGGPTLTRAPACGGPAIDQGSAAASGVHPALTSDQRGQGRPVDLAAANAAGGDGSDVGAVERQDACVSPLVAAVLADGADGYWRFGAATDSSGNGNNVTFLGGVTLGVPGALGGSDTAALFDGVNDQARVPDSNSLDVGNSFSAEAWIKRSSAAQTHELMNKGASGIQLVVMNAASQNRVVLRRAGVASIAQSTTGVAADGRFHHVVATMNGLGSTARIYIDGVDVTQVLAPGQTILNTSFPLTFGSFGSAPSTPATYDEFALYDSALTPAQVQAHYAAGAP